MKLFLDTADIGAVREAASWGVLDGVTMNAGRIAEIGRSLEEVVNNIVEIVPGPVIVEVAADEIEPMVDQARNYADFASNIVIAIPMLVEGLKAVRLLADEGIKTDVTQCFSAVQALLAAKAGATYVSPVIGRSDDSDLAGVESIREICTIFDNYQLGAQVLVTSARSSWHVRDAGVIGANAITVPIELFAELVRHPLAGNGMAKLADGA
jgi:transaldolase